jgi:beta-N-acetylhexosaminidase
VKVLFGDITPTGTLPGTIGESQILNPSRQHWLVETFNEDRDSRALDDLVRAVADAAPADHPSALAGASSATLLPPHHPDVLQAHFVVRRGGGGGGSDSSDSAVLLGFCATYFFRASGTGAIGALLVDPRHRRRCVGRELHARAVRALLLREGARRFQLGARLPSAFPGVPRAGGGDPATAAAAGKAGGAPRHHLSWFANMGWNTSQSRALCSLVAPLGGLVLGGGGAAATGGWQGAAVAALRASGARFDLVFDWEHAGDVLDLARDGGDPARPPPPGTAELYELALTDSGGWLVGAGRGAAAAAAAAAVAGGGSSAGGGSCGVIRARSGDGAVVGAAVVFLAGCRLADHVPALRAAGVPQPAGGVAAPVVAASAAAGERERAALARGLVLLGMRYLKRQGCASCVLDYVSVAVPHFLTS